MQNIFPIRHKALDTNSSAPTILHTHSNSDFLTLVKITMIIYYETLNVFINTDFSSFIIYNSLSPMKHISTLLTINNSPN